MECPGTGEHVLQRSPTERGRWRTHSITTSPCWSSICACAGEFAAGTVSRWVAEGVLAGAAEELGAGQRPIGFVQAEGVVAAEAEHADRFGVEDGWETAGEAAGEAGRAKARRCGRPPQGTPPQRQEGGQDS